MSDIQSTQMLTRSEWINVDIQEQTVVPQLKVTLAPTNTHEVWSLEINSSSCHFQRLTKMLLRGMTTWIYRAEMNPACHFPPQPTGSTSTWGDAVTDLPQITKTKTAPWSVCKMLVCGIESSPSSRDSCEHREAPGSISPWMLFWWEGCSKASQPPVWNGCRIGSVKQRLDRETTLLTFDYILPSLPNTWQKQEQALLGHGAIFTYTSTYPHTARVATGQMTAGH